jgi:hypothetical protein
LQKSLVRDKLEGKRGCPSLGGQPVSHVSAYFLKDLVMSSARPVASRLLGVLIAFSSLACVVFVSGCGSGDPYSYVPASGKITYEDGTPIQAPQVSLTFIAIDPPTSGDEKIHARPGNVSPDPKTGEFADITTHKPFDGLLPGKHKVIVNPRDEMGRPLQGVVPPEYSDVNKTPIVVDTTKPETFQIKVKKPAGGVKPVAGAGGRRGER